MTPTSIDCPDCGGPVPAGQLNCPGCGCYLPLAAPPAPPREPTVGKGPPPLPKEVAPPPPPPGVERNLLWAGLGLGGALLFLLLAGVLAVLSLPHTREQPQEDLLLASGSVVLPPRQEKKPSAVTPLSEEPKDRELAEKGPPEKNREESAPPLKVELPRLPPPLLDVKTPLPPSQELKLMLPLPAPKEEPTSPKPGLPPSSTLATLDRFGNPTGLKRGLHPGLTFDKVRLLVWSGEPEVIEAVFTPENPLWKPLEERGFVIRIEKGKFKPAWLKDADQFWLFAGKQAAMDQAGYAAVVKFVRSGKGLYLLADNDPYTAEADVLARHLFGTRIFGNYVGTQIASVKGRGLSPEEVRKFGGQYQVQDHPLLTGLNFLYEGITISHVEPCPKLARAVLASDGQTLVAVSRDPKQKVVIDCGWTRYYYGKTEDQRFITKTAGTALLGENVAVYLTGKGK